MTFSVKGGAYAGCAGAVDCEGVLDATDPRLGLANLVGTHDLSRPRHLLSVVTEPSGRPRVYGETEIGRILKRATELQHAEPAGGAAGVTLAELEEIAAEAGIEPTYLRRAALELDSGLGGHTVWTTVLGEEIHLVREVTIPGELPDDGFERIVETVHAHTPEHGQPSLLGRTLTWRAETPGKTRTMQLVVTSRDGVTHVRLEENLAQFASGLFAGTTLGGGVGLGMGAGIPLGLKVLGSALFAGTAAVGTVGLAYVASRVIYRGIVAGRRRRLAELFDRVVATATALAEEAAAALPPPSVRRGRTP